MNNKPFSREYVIRTTLKNMRKAVDLSLSKTYDRVAEFAGDPEMSAEILRTLSTLHIMQRNINEYITKDI